MPKTLYKYILILLNVIFLTRQVYAIDISTSINKAYLYNADYLGAVDKNNANQEISKQAKSLLLPQVSVSGGISENSLSASGLNMTYHQPSIGVSFSQNLINFNAFSAYTKALFNNQLSINQLHLDQEDLSLKVVRAYLDVLYMNDTLNALKEARKFYQEQYEKATQSYSAGTVSNIDVNDSKAYLDEAIANETTYLNKLNNAKNYFQNLTGENADLVQPLVSQINLSIDKSTNLKDLQDASQNQNPTVILYKIQQDMAREDINMSKANHLPNASLYGLYSYFGPTSIDSSSPTVAGENSPGATGSSFSYATAGIQVSIPIFSGGNINSQTRQAIANYEAATQSLISSKRSALTDVTNAYWQAINGISLMNANNIALKSARLKLKSDKLAYSLGVRNSVTLMNSEKLYYDSIQNYNQARYNYLIATTQIMYLTNKLDNNFIEKLNQNIQH